jgi:hypothetical protein
MNRFFLLGFNTFMIYELIKLKSYLKFFVIYEIMR